MTWTLKCNDKGYYYEYAGEVQEYIRNKLERRNKYEHDNNE